MGVGGLEIEYGGEDTGPGWSVIFGLWVGAERKEAGLVELETEFMDASLSIDEDGAFQIGSSLASWEKDQISGIGLDRHCKKAESSESEETCTNCHGNRYVTGSGCCELISGRENCMAFGSYPAKCLMCEKDMPLYDMDAIRSECLRNRSCKSETTGCAYCFLRVEPTRVRILISEGDLVSAELLAKSGNTYNKAYKCYICDKGYWPTK